jgi:hypothetical protein
MTRVLGAKPSNFKAGEKYPLLLEIHGGSAMWGLESSMWHEYQYFAVMGMELCTATKRFWRLQFGFPERNINDWGNLSNDVTALDKTVEFWADKSKL